MKKVTVNKDLCIACGACMSVAPDVFKFDSDGLSAPKVSEVNDDEKSAVNAMEACPTGAIMVESSDDSCDCETCECDHCDCKHEE